MEIVNHRKDLFRGRLNVDGTLDTEGVGPGRSVDENSRDQNGDDRQNSQDHGALRVAFYGDSYRNDKTAPCVSTKRVAR
jgi:hypothetical protein